jgi:hypothetical protein
MAKRKRKPQLLSEQLQRIILEGELSRYRICKMAGIDQGQLHRFVTTGRGISIETLDRIGQALRLRLVVEDE